MKKFYIIGFFILLCFDTFSQTSFKIAAVHTSPPSFDLPWIWRLLTEQWIYFAVLSYLGAFVTYMTLLEHAPVGPAFAASHLEIVTVLMVSVAFLGEKLSWMQVVGSVLIMAGIYLLGTEKEQPKPELAVAELQDVA